MYGTAAATGRPTACGRKSVNCRDRNAHASYFDPKNMRRHRVLVQYLDTQSELCGTVAGEASFNLFAQSGMLLDDALQVAPCGLAKVRRVRLLDEAAKPRGIFESVCAYVGHGRIAASRRGSGSPCISLVGASPRHRQGAPRPSKSCCEKKLPLWRTLRGRVKRSRLAILRNST